MTAFKLNIPKLRENISNYKKIIGYCNNDINSVYNNLKNIDSCWNDSTSIAFTEEIKSDKYNLHNYFNNINFLYKQIDVLKSSFENLLAKYRYNKASVLTYNDEYYEICIQNLKNVISDLDSALSYLNSCNFKATFPEIYKVYQLRAEIKKIKENINGLINSIALFKNSVDKILSDINSNINKNEDIEFELTEKTYNWKLVDFSVNKVTND